VKSQYRRKVNRGGKEEEEEKERVKGKSLGIA
jgi:hypothetical protein